jgi:hypothetical protein
MNSNIIKTVIDGRIIWGEILDITNNEIFDISTLKKHVVSPCDIKCTQEEFMNDMINPKFYALPYGIINNIKLILANNKYTIKNAFIYDKSNKHIIKEYGKILFGDLYAYVGDTDKHIESFYAYGDGNLFLVIDDPMNVMNSVHIDINEANLINSDIKINKHVIYNQTSSIPLLTV